MSKALEGMHYCKEHQGNHSHYATENCEVCRLRAEVVSLKELNKLDKEVHSKMPELVGEIAHLTQQLAAANGRVEKYREALEFCAWHGLKVTESDKAMAALSDLPEADKEKSE